MVIARKGHPSIHGKLDARTFKALGHVVVVPELRGLAHVEKDLIARRIGNVVTKLWSIAPMVERTDLIGVLPRRFAEEIESSFDIALHEPPVPLSAQHFCMMWNAKNTNDPGHMAAGGDHRGHGRGDAEQRHRDDAGASRCPATQK